GNCGRSGWRPVHEMADQPQCGADRGETYVACAASGFGKAGGDAACGASASCGGATPGGANCGKPGRDDYAGPTFTTGASFCTKRGDAAQAGQDSPGSAEDGSAKCHAASGWSSQRGASTDNPA